MYQLKILFILIGNFVLVSTDGNISINHDYYEKIIYDEARNPFEYKQYLVDMSDSKVHRRLSNQSIGAANANLTEYFRFPFYGHEIDKVYITTDGFLSLASRVHRNIYKIQYIAPLRLKLDPSLSEESIIRHRLTENSFTVEWTRMRLLNSSEKNPEETTFQSTLYKNGDIAFVYIKTHNNISAYSNEVLYDDELAIGISDGFELDGSLYHYHTISVPKNKIKDQTVVLFRAKPTCIRQQNCEDCLDLTKKSDFKCSWCPEIQRCSDGADRLREHWDTNKCPDFNVTQLHQCPNIVKSNAENTKRTRVAIIVIAIMAILMVISFLILNVLRRKRSKQGFSTLNEVPNDVRMLELEDQ